MLQVRRAVRAELAHVGDGCVLVACSGGADSLALAAALAAEARRVGVAAGGVTVDHGLQQDSARRARNVGATLVAMGLDPVESLHVRIARGPSGPEGDARRARYSALQAAAARHRAAAVLLGHTLDDQAETVLLGLARGSGARSLAGMAPRTGVFRRPLLRLSRRTVRAAVPDGVEPWEDPHNADAAYARARVRHRVLPALEAELGPGMTEALARTAHLLRADADALDTLAHEAKEAATVGPAEHTATAGSVGYDVTALASSPRAVRWRVLRAAALEAGCGGSDLTAAHVESIDALISEWHGQKGVDLPGAIRVTRSGGALWFGRMT
ncbi:tRNA lysidine(34) synthetase TilS [Phytoactinopolyspora halotolerans]|uniref:tRNA(Ile)-lysidine synthase n=1 Tax=Phytoactinopolyspora halotolerans TaxID=1981512 RepID=A0A6L9S3I2_9ACTN|nr:tRNA lysidine(34) synthetase TilS [Phytoactinopolyspora halotolerans]